MTFDYKHFVLSHLVWIMAVIVAVIGFYSWRGEHDSRLLADAQVSASNAVVKSLQQQISVRDSAAQKQQAVIVKVIHDVQTPAQAIARLPEVVNTPLPVPVAVASTGDLTIPQPDIVSLFQQLGDDKLCRSQLTMATADLSDTQAIVAQRDVEIKTLKKKPSFWHRVGGTMKAVGIGVGIGIAIGAHFL